MVVRSNSIYKDKDAFLLELSNCFDYSSKIGPSASSFLKKVKDYYHLDFIGCWQKEDEASNNLTPHLACPTKAKRNTIQNKSFYNYISSQSYTLLNFTQKYNKQALELIFKTEGHVLFFNTAFYIILLHRKNGEFSSTEGDFIQQKMMQFGAYAKLIFEKNILQENVIAMQTREKHVLFSKQKNEEEKIAFKNELLEVQSIMEIMFQNMTDGVIIYNYIKEKNIAYNSAALKMFGYDSGEEFLKISRIDFIPQYSKFFPNMDLHEYTRGHGIKVSNGESIDKTIGIFVKKNKSQFLVEANVVPTHREKGEAFIIFRDTTDRIIDQKNLKKSEEKYKQIFDNADEAIIYFDFIKDQIIDCNQQTLKLFEFNKKEKVLKSSIYDYFFAEESENFQNKIIKRNLNQVKEFGISKLQIWLKTFNGKRFRAEITLIAESKKAGFNKIIIFVRDITEKYNAEQALYKQHQKLKKYIESNLQLENFAYIASHDLQTPLRTIISFTQLLRKNLNDKLQPEEFEYMEFIIKATKNMLNLVKDLLNFSNINNGTLQFKRISINTLLSQLIKEIEYDIKKSKSKIIFLEEDIIIDADELKLKQLFQNLILNAIKFSKKDDSPLVTISAENSKNYWHFKIKDNGIGIKKEYQEKIFLLFKRLHTKSEFEGTGIGLSICKKIVEQHGGEIGFNSEYGKGTTFYFSIKKEIL